MRGRRGPEGIADMDEAYGRMGAITDDTQRTLFTAEGFLRARCRETTKGIRGAAVSIVRDSYLRWLHTQGVPLRAASRDRILGPDFADGSRAGRALRTARTRQHLPERPPHAEPDQLEARIASKGCGAVMRVAPVALYMAALTCSDEFKYAETFRLAMAGITHERPTAKLSGGVLATLILGIVEGDALGAALDRAMSFLRSHESRGETEAAIDRARQLAAGGVEPAAALPELGEGW